jgi:hypothetical protein
VLYEVKIPEDALVYEDPYDYKWKADRLILVKEVDNIEKYLEHPSLLYSYENILPNLAKYLAKSTVREYYNRQIIRGMELINIPEEHYTYQICWALIEKRPSSLECVPEKFKTFKLCRKAVRRCGRALKDVPEKFKTKEMCLMAYKRDKRVLKYVPQKWQEFVQHGGRIN